MRPRTPESHPRLLTGGRVRLAVRARLLFNQRKMCRDFVLEFAVELWAANDVPEAQKRRHDVLTRIGVPC